MALNIKDGDTDRLARELASVTGEGITTAVRRAVEERLARVRVSKSAQPAADELRALIERGRRRAILDNRSAEQILEYDEHGMPA